MLKGYREIARQLSQISEVGLVVLYGSYARGDFGPKSDVDLLILISKSAAIEKVHDAVILIEEKIGKAIQPTIRTMEEFRRTDSGLLQNIFREGKILYLREFFEIPVAEMLKQKPYVIYTFAISSMRQKDKAKFNREFYSRKTKGKYEYQGLLQKLGGEKLASGCVLMPFAKKAGLEKLFKKHKISYSSKNIWA